MMPFTKFGFTITVDLHGYTVAEARRELPKLITSCDKLIKEIDVIHGYSGGTALQNYVRKELKHKRIVRKILTMNQGSTTLIIEPNK